MRASARSSYREVNEVARAIDADVTVVSLEPTSIEGILNSISTVGAMTDAEDAAVDVVGDLRERLRKLETRLARRRERGQPPVRVVGLEWLDPPFARRPLGPRAGPAGRRLGPARPRGRGVRPDDAGTRSREVDPEMLVLMPCGFHLAETVDRVGADAEAGVLARARGRPARPGLRRRRVGLLLAAGPRVIDGIGLLAEIFDPDGFVETSPLGSWTPLV